MKKKNFTLVVQLKNIPQEVPEEYNLCTDCSPHFQKMLRGVAQMIKALDDKAPTLSPKEE
jgi:dethiobiotin synthetase